MKLLPIKIPPGFYRNATQYQAKNRWYKGNLVRFSEGRLRPIGGWQRLTDTQIVKKTDSTVVDPLRGMHSWRLNSGSRFLAVGSVESLYIWDGESAGEAKPPIYDITPATLTNFNNTVIGAGNNLDFPISGLGYGSLNYDEDVYGTPRYPADSDIFAATWSMDNFGDDLLACHSNEGTIYKWASTAASFNNATQTATSATALTNAPTSNKGVLVTPERHVLAYGAGGSHSKIQWSHAENSEIWTPTATNTAGDLTLQTKGKIVAGFKSRYGTLIFTTADVWRLNYIGTPYIYGAERLTEGAGPIGSKCIAGSADFVAWMSAGRFWSYTGGYIKELPCEVADYVFSDINLDIEGLIAAGHNVQFGEITWFYPKEGDSVPKHYVTYSYRENHWTTGELHRSAWESADALGYPVAGGTDGYLYRHEMNYNTQSAIPREAGVSAPGNVPGLSGMVNRVMAKGVSTDVSGENHLCYAETGAFEIGSGNKFMQVIQIITDSDAGENGLRMGVKVADTPDDAVRETLTYPLENDGYTDVRFSGRQAILKVESPFDQEWRFGEIRLDAKASGRR